MSKQKTEAQRRKEYEKKQEKLEKQYHEYIRKAREKQRKASKKVNYLESRYQNLQTALRRKFYHNKKVRANRSKK